MVLILSNISCSPKGNSKDIYWLCPLDKSKHNYFTNRVRYRRRDGLRCVEDICKVGVVEFEVPLVVELEKGGGVGVVVLEV